MSGFNFDGSKFVITDGARTVSTTDGTLVCLLPDRVSFDVSVTFPDFSKDYLYAWQFTQVGSGTSNIAIANRARHYVTARPQEYTGSTTLQTAPAGADFFIGRVKINRTSAPDDTWMGKTIPCLVPQNEWIGWNGSALVEQMIGMSRVLHVYINSSGRLVVERQQSVAVPIGGWGSYGKGGPSAAPGSDTPTGGRNRSSGGSSTRGIPIWTSDSGGHLKITNPQNYDSVTFTPGWNDCDLGQSNAATLNDPTDHKSTYRVRVDGRFGRRS